MDFYMIIIKVNVHFIPFFCLKNNSSTSLLDKLNPKIYNAIFRSEGIKMDSYYAINMV